MIRFGPKEEKVPYIPSTRKRFDISPDVYSRERIKTALEIYRFFEREAPGLIAMTVWGSLTKGKELTPDTARKADVDFTIYMDVDRAYEFLREVATFGPTLATAWKQEYARFWEYEEEQVKIQTEQCETLEMECNNIRARLNQEFPDGPFLRRQFEGLMIMRDSLFADFERTKDPVIKSKFDLMDRQLADFEERYKGRLAAEKELLRDVRKKQKQLDELKTSVEKRKSLFERERRAVHLLGMIVMDQVRSQWISRQQQTQFFIEDWEKNQESWVRRHQEPVYIRLRGPDSVYDQVRQYKKMIDQQDPDSMTWSIDVAAFFALDVGGGLKKYRQAFFQEVDELHPHEAELVWVFIKTCIQHRRYPNNAAGWERFQREVPQGYEEARRYYGLEDL